VIQSGAVTALRIDPTRIRETAAGVMEDLHLPGLAIGVVSGDDLVYAEGFGFADIETRRPYEPHLRQRIGSITKTMVSLCVMALVDEGRLSLDDRITELLPDISFQGPATALAVRHLLTHTGGLGEAPNLEDIKQPFRFLFSDEKATGALADAYPNGITIEVPPGTRWAYANHGFSLLGEIVSRLERAPMAEVLERRVFRPLGMASSDNLDRLHPDLSTGYQQAATPEQRQQLEAMGVQLETGEPVDGYNMRGKYLGVWGNGAQGAVQSTVPDMARYASALLRRGGGIVRPETFAEMTRAHWRADERLPGWGLGFEVRSFFGEPAFAHGGGVFGGWNTQLAVFPRLDAAVIAHVNLMHDETQRKVFPAIIGAVLGRMYVPPDVPLSTELLEGLPGVYELEMPGPLTQFRPMSTCGRVMVRRDGETLTLYSRRGPWRPGFALRAADASQPDLLVLDTGDPAPPYIIAMQDGAERVKGLRFGLCAMYRNEALEPWS